MACRHNSSHRLCVPGLPPDPFACMAPVLVCWGRPLPRGFRPRRTRGPSRFIWVRRWRRPGTRGLYVSGQSGSQHWRSVSPPGARRTPIANLMAPKRPQVGAGHPVLIVLLPSCPVPCTLSARQARGTPDSRREKVHPTTAADLSHGLGPPTGSIVLGRPWAMGEMTTVSFYLHHRVHARLSADVLKLTRICTRSLVNDWRVARQFCLAARCPALFCGIGSAPHTIPSRSRGFSPF